MASEDFKAKMVKAPDGVMLYAQEWGNSTGPEIVFIHVCERGRRSIETDPFFRGGGDNLTCHGCRHLLGKESKGEDSADMWFQWGHRKMVKSPKPRTTATALRAAGFHAVGAMFNLTLDGPLEASASISPLPVSKGLPALERKLGEDPGQVFPAEWAEKSTYRCGTQ